MREPAVPILLAGGSSSRMGRDKALLQLAGETWLHRTARVLREACDGTPELWVSGEARPEVSLPHVHYVTDELPGRGAVEGLRSVLARLQPRDGTLLLIAPVDMPLLRPQTLRRLVDEFYARRDLEATYYIGHILPLALRWTPAVAKAFSDKVAGSRGRSLYSCLACLKQFELPAAKPLLAELRNLNTPEDVRSLQD